MIRKTGLVSGVVAALFLGVASSASAGTLDQQQTDFSAGTGTVDSGQTSAQTFTAGLSGGIDQVDVHLESSGTPTTPLNVEIRDISGGAPGGTVLAGQSVPASSVPAAGSWVTVNFATPAPVTAGSQYAIVAYSSTLSITQHYFWGYGGDSYAGGGFTYTSTRRPPVPGRPGRPWTSRSRPMLGHPANSPTNTPQPTRRRSARSRSTTPPRQRSTARRRSASAASRLASILSRISSARARARKGQQTGRSPDDLRRLESRY